MLQRFHMHHLMGHLLRRKDHPQQRPCRNDANVMGNLALSGPASPFTRAPVELCALRALRAYMRYDCSVRGCSTKRAPVCLWADTDEVLEAITKGGCGAKSDVIGDPFNGKIRRFQQRLRVAQPGTV